jgi:hypothetical protein
VFLLSSRVTEALNHKAGAKPRQNGSNFVLDECINVTFQMRNST